MDEKRRFEAEAIFEAAVDLPVEKREAFLSTRCGDDGKLRALVNQLFADYDSGMGSFLQPPDGEASSETIPQDRAQESTSIGPYRILETIGEGGMGTVYAAEQTRPVRRQVAIKVIRPGMDSKQAIARFEAERQALALMDHPNIARVLDAGETKEGRLYFAMDLVKGVPITEYCDRDTLSTKERLALFIPVCHAVQHAHQKGIIHRDLKPSNILVTLSDGKPVPKVIDFGIAKATRIPLTDATLYTQVGQLIGTPAFMSPEQADGGALDVDTRSDIYSLGVVLYELLAGALPFDPEKWRKADLADVRRIIREEDPPKPSTKVSTAGDRSKDIAQRHRTDVRTLVRQLKGELDWIVLKAMDKDRHRRYETANTLATDIGRYLRDEPVLAGPPSASYRFRKYAKRHRVGISVAAAVAFGLVATGVSLTWALIESNRQRAKVEAALAEAQKARDEAEAALGEAQEARDESEAVTDFLSEMLASVKPAERGLDVTVREVLSEASEKVGERFEDRSLIEARLRNTIGTTYHALGEFTVATTHLERAAEIRSRMLGPDHPETLKSLYHLAFAYGMNEWTAKATSLLQDVLDRQRRVLGETHEDTRESTRLLILLYKDQRRYPEGESLALRAIDTWTPTLGEDALPVNMFRYALALVYERQGRYEGAEALMDSVLKKTAPTMGDDHYLILEFKHVLARLYTAMGRFAEAEPLHLEVLDGRRRVQGVESTRAMRSRWDLAGLYALMGRYDEAEQLHRENIDIGSRARGDEDIHTLSARLELARLWTRQGRYSEADSLLVQNVAMRRRVQGRGHRDTMQAMGDLATVYIAQGRYDEAERLWSEVLETQRRELGEGHPNLSRSLYNLACLASLRGHRARALDFLRRSVEHGYSNADRLIQDPNLQPLHGNPEFEALAEELRQRTEQQAATKPPARVITTSLSTLRQEDRIKSHSTVADSASEHRTEN